MKTVCPPRPQERLAVARKLIQRAGDYGIPPEDIMIDCLALTVGADHNAGRITLDSIALVRQELGVNLNLGASNVSFGLPDRKIINVAYLALAIARGLTTAITDPTVPEIQTTLLACDLLMGRDEYAMRWIKAFRKREKAAAAARRLRRSIPSRARPRHADRAAVQRIDGLSQQLFNRYFVMGLSQSAFWRQTFCSSCLLLRRRRFGHIRGGSQRFLRHNE